MLRYCLLPLLRSPALPPPHRQLSRLAADVTTAAATASTAQRGSNIGKAFAANTLLGPLLGLGTVPDLSALLRNQGVTSKATEVFTSLRGYPTNQGEVSGAKKLLEGCLGRLQGATEQVAKRLLKAKVGRACGAMQGVALLQQYKATLLCATGL